MLVRGTEGDAVHPADLRISPLIGRPQLDILQICCITSILEQKIKKESSA